MLIAKLFAQLFTKLRPSSFIAFITQINHYRNFAALPKFTFFVSWLAIHGWYKLPSTSNVASVVCFKQRQGKKQL